MISLWHVTSPSVPWQRVKTQHDDVERKYLGSLTRELGSWSRLKSCFEDVDVVFIADHRVKESLTSFKVVFFFFISKLQFNPGLTDPLFTEFRPLQMQTFCPFSLISFVSFIGSNLWCQRVPGSKFQMACSSLPDGSLKIVRTFQISS